MNQPVAMVDVDLPKREPPPLRCTALFIGGLDGEAMKRHVTGQYPCDKTPLAIARRTVEQWDRHDKFKAILEEGNDEPGGVVVARHYMRLYGLLEQAESWIAASVKDGTILDERDQNVAVEFGVKITEALNCVR